MGRNLTLLVLLAAVLALPFCLRTKTEHAVAGAQDTLVIISPHNEAIRHEFEAGFKKWYLARTGRVAGFDWRLIGGTSEINRYLEGEYAAAFQNHWTQELGRNWSGAVAASWFMT